MMGQTNSPSSPEVMATLRWMRAHNIKPVAVFRASKAAVNKDFAGADYKPPTDDAWRNQDLNIGALLGPAVGGPVDVDLDCKEAIWFAPKFLPKTKAVFGRKSKPASHYLYRFTCQSYPKVSFIDPTSRDTIVEIRADGGHQSVFPGSIHQDSKEVIAWTDFAFPEIAVVDDEVVTKAVKKITIATLISRYLWNDGSRNETNKHLAGIFFNLGWEMEEVIHLIETVMEYNGDDDKTRLITIKATFNKGEKGGKVSGAPSLRKLIGSSQIVDKILDLAGSNTINLMNEYNEKFAVVDMSGKFRVVGFPDDPTEGLTFYSDEDFIKLNRTDVVTIDGKDVPKGLIWLKSPLRRQYRGMDFYPGGHEPAKILNMWSGWGVEPDAHASCAGWLELLREVVCGGDEFMFDWMLHWFASIVREPRQKSMTAPVIIGTQGAGKSLLLAYFGRIMPQNYCVITNDEQITGKFNRHLSTALLVHSEEALYGGDKKHRGIIKSLISDESRMMEAKGVDATKVKNFIRLVLTSNEPHAAPTERDDRRFTVIDMHNRKISSDLIKQVVSEMEGQGPAALLHHLLEMPYDPMKARINVKNEDLVAMKEHNLGPVEQWWQDALMGGVMLPDYLRWSQKPSEHDWPAIVSIKALYVSLVLHCHHSRSRNVPGSGYFSKVLRNMVGVDLATRAARFDVHLRPENATDAVRAMPAVMHSIVNMPSLEDCRAGFEAHIGGKVEWPEGLSEEDKKPWDKV